MRASYCNFVGNSKYFFSRFMPPTFVYIIALMAYLAVACAVWGGTLVLAIFKPTRTSAKKIAAGMAGSFPGVFLFQLPRTFAWHGLFDCFRRFALLPTARHYNDNSGLAHARNSDSCFFVGLLYRLASCLGVGFRSPDSRIPRKGPNTWPVHSVFSEAMARSNENIIERTNRLTSRQGRKVKGRLV